MQYCEFQLQNAAGVLMVLNKIRHEYPVSENDIRQGLNNFRLNGRMQIIPGEIAKILDVAHNRESVKALVENLRMMPCHGKTHVLLGMLKDKDHNEVFKVLKEIVDSWNIVSLSQDRGCDAKKLIFSCCVNLTLLHARKKTASISDWQGSGLAIAFRSSASF